MNKIYCGHSGNSNIGAHHKLSDIPADQCIVNALIRFYGSDFKLRPAQSSAVFDHGLLRSKDNFILATPTNSGKSLISYLLAFQTALSGGRVILIEPLRALAYEKAEELKEISQFIYEFSKRKVKVIITTGDYRLNDEFMSDKPKDGHGQKERTGEIVIATPERLDAISRNKKNDHWFNGIDLVCFDEAHLLGDPHRGATIELFMTYLKTLNNVPRMILMSATISNAEDIAKWLNPCTVISNIERYPILDKWMYHLDDQDDLDECLFEEIKEILSDSENSVIVFVYRTASAESLAHKFVENLSGTKVRKNDLPRIMDVGVGWYHSKMSAGTKTLVRQALLDGKVRLVFSTTALSMGINLPATHVIVRDVVFSGAKTLDTGELTQMIGRAGRGDRKGTGIVFLRSDDTSTIGTMEYGLKNDLCPTIKSQLIPYESEGYYGKKKEDHYYTDRIGNQLIGILNHIGPITHSGFEKYMLNTYGGKDFASHLTDVLSKLTSWKLVYRSEETNEYDLTALGKTAATSYTPPIAAANNGQLIRDFLYDDPEGGHIAQFSQVDLLITLCLTSPEIKPIARYSKALEQKVISYMEALPLVEKSYLYRKWIASDAASLMGSSRMDARYNAADAHKHVFQVTFTAMLLYDISKGLSLKDVQARYGLDVGEGEEKLRDTVLWLLSGLAKILDVRNFYYHLKTSCDAEYDKIRMVENVFKKTSRQIFGLIENLKFRSSLGELIRGIKRTFPNAKSYPGESSIRKLELIGVANLRGLIEKKPQDLVNAGLSRPHADLICAYIQRRRA